MFVNTYNSMGGGRYDINDKRIPQYDTQMAEGKIVVVDDGNIIPSNTTLMNIFAHYIFIQGTDATTVICLTLMTNSSIEFTAQTLVDYINSKLTAQGTTTGISCTGSVRISSLDHKQCVQIRKGNDVPGDPTATIQVMPIQATGGFDNAVSVSVSNITTLVDNVVRIL